MSSHESDIVAVMEEASVTAYEKQIKLHKQHLEIEDLDPKQDDDKAGDNRNVQRTGSPADL